MLSPAAPYLLPSLLLYFKLSYHQLQKNRYTQQTMQQISFTRSFGVWSGLGVWSPTSSWLTLSFVSVCVTHFFYPLFHFFIFFVFDPLSCDCRLPKCQQEPEKQQKKSKFSENIYKQNHNNFETNRWIKCCEDFATFFKTITW